MKSTLLCLLFAFMANLMFLITYGQRYGSIPTFGIEGGYLAGGGMSNGKGSGGYVNLWCEPRISNKLYLIMKLNYSGSNITQNVAGISDTSIHETTIPIMLGIHISKGGEDVRDENGNYKGSFYFSLNFFCGPQIGFYNLIDQGDSPPKNPISNGTKYSLVFGGCLGLEGAAKHYLLIYKQFGLTNVYPSRYSTKSFNPLCIGFGVSIW